MAKIMDRLVKQKPEILAADFLVFDSGKLRAEPQENYPQYTATGTFGLVNLKVGSGVSFPDGNLTVDNINSLGEEIAEVAEQWPVHLIASGSEAMGRYLRHVTANGEAPEERLRYVRLGKKLIFDFYTAALEKHGIKVVRHYVTQEEAARGLPKVRGLLQQYKGRSGVVILTNEDDEDTIQRVDIDGVGYRVFKDNDGLWALTTERAAEDGLRTLAMNVCAVDGIYEGQSWEKGNPDTIEVILNSDGLERQASSKRRRSVMSRGGVASKIDALQRLKPVAYAGVVNGLYSEHGDGYRPVIDFINGERVGTRSPPADFALRQNGYRARAA